MRGVSRLSLVGGLAAARGLAAVVVLAAVALLLVLASRRPSAPGDGPTGVQVVESSAPLWEEGAAWHIPGDPIMEIGAAGEGAPYEFDRVRDVLRLASGQVVVGDGGSQQLRVYSADGSFVRAFGGSGDGPGEFRWLASLVALRNGRVAAVELEPGGRGAVFDVETGLVETFRLPAGAFPVRQPILSDGETWGRLELLAEASRRLPGMQRPHVRVVRLAADFTHADTVLSIVGDETFIAPTADAIPVMGRRTHVVPGHGGQVVVGTADRLEFARIDAATGRTLSTARILGVPLAVSAQEVDRELQARLGPRPSARVREIMTGLPVPDSKPAYERLLVDAEDNVWAGEFLGMARRDAPRKWYVWDTGGAWLGVVETPARFDLMRIGADELLGVRRDGNDVERPQVLRLVKP